MSELDKQKRSDTGRSPAQTRGVRLTVALVVAFMVVIVAGFVYRIQQPRVMTATEMKANGLFVFETPRALGQFELTDHRGQPFTQDSLRGGWTLIFFGFTYCPDICPTTMAFLNQLMGELEGTEVADTSVVMISTPCSLSLSPKSSTSTTTHSLRSNRGTSWPSAVAPKRASQPIRGHLRSS